MNILMTRIPTSHMDLDEVDVNNLLDAIFVNYKLYIDTWDDQAYVNFIRLMNKYLELIEPVKYIPRATELLHERLVLRLWESNIPIETLREFMELLILVKELANRKDSNIVHEYERTSKLFNKVLSELSDRSMPVNMDKFVECDMDIYERSLCLISLSTITLIISTNPD